jgi:TonB family protein
MASPPPQQFTLKGPCGTGPKCPPVIVDLAPDGEKLISSQILIKLLVLPNGTPRDVAILKSSGSKKIDMQIVTGVMRWRFESASEEREVLHSVTINLRR